MAIPFASKNGLAIGVLLLILLATPITAFFLYQNKNPQTNAAGTSGTGTMTVLPTTLDIAKSETKQVKVYFNSNGKAVNLAQAVLKYSFTGNTPQVTAGNVTLDSTLRANDWACGILKSEVVSQNVEISISCTNSSDTGYISNGEVLFATFDLTANSSTSPDSFQITFVTADSYLLEKSTGSAVDILKPPTSAVSVAVNGGNNSNSTAADTIKTHKVCINSACTEIRGEGSNECSTVGTSCTSVYKQEAVTGCTGRYDPNCYNCVDDEGKDEINILDFSCFKAAFGKERTSGISWE